MNIDRLVPAIRAAVRRGNAVTVMAEVPGDIERARAASRSMCARLEAALGGAGLHASRSATPGLAAVALCRQAGVGIDVERIRPDWIDDGMRELALHPAERAATTAMNADAFFAIWTGKEALLKALGVGLSVPPSSLDIGCPRFQWAACDLRPIGLAFVRSLDAPHGFCAAIGALGRQPELQSWMLECDSLGPGPQGAKPLRGFIESVAF